MLESSIVSGEDDVELERASTKIQASYRGYKARRDGKSFKSKKTKSASAASHAPRLSIVDGIDSAKANSAATVVQSGFRGHKDRKKVKALKASRKSSSKVALSSSKVSLSVDAIATEDHDDHSKMKKEAIASPTTIDAGYDDDFENEGFEDDEETNVTTTKKAGSAPTSPASTAKPSIIAAPSPAVPIEESKPSEVKSAFAKPTSMAAKKGKKDYL